VCEEDKITQILVANVVQTGETERELKIATINIVGGMEIEDILDGEETQTITIESETALTFDAKEEYNNSTDIHSQIENIIQENLGENATQADEYEVEEFEPESPLPQTVAEMVAEYPEKVNEVLNEYFLDDALKTGRTTSLDANLIHDAKWYLIGEREVESLDFVFHYTRSETAETFYVRNLAFDKNATISDILNNQSNLNYISTTRTSTYSFGYATKEQGTRDELMNAIFEVYGMGSTCPEGAVRLFKDNGYFLDLTIGETNAFVVTQITDNQIIQFGIRIKQSESDTEYINKLNNTSNYKHSETNNAEVNLTGEIVNYSPTASEVTATALKSISNVSKINNTAVLLKDDKKYLI
ncbi:MAG: hypothetical protein IJX25_04335, partial [Clostridia bacterium]|nr:hypothetical protein [Clostridia bacterium]